MSTLADYGVQQVLITPPPDDALPPMTLIKACPTWGEVVEILERNKITHPEDKVWILNRDEMFLVKREVTG